MDVDHLPDDFSNWLNELTRNFQQFSEDQRNEVLDRLIDESSSVQLHHLSEKLPLLVKRDFIRLLPFELIEHLLHFLDGKTLLSCCVVSKTWNRVINQSYRAWRRACIVTGSSEEYVNSHCTNPASLSHQAKAGRFKTNYLVTLQKLRDLKSDQTFSRVILKGHQSRIMAVYYHDGKVATGCDDRTVRLWHVATGRCLLKIVTTSVSDVKFDEKFIFTASFDNTAACWDLNTGSHIQTYIGHIAAIFSVDFDASRNLVVTGAADRVIILWQLSSGELLHSIAGHHTGWVMKVRLLPMMSSNSSSDLANFNSNFPVITETIELISACSNTAFRWTVVRDEEGYSVADAKPVHSPPANFSLHQSFEVRGNISSFYLSDRNAREGYLYCCPSSLTVKNPRHSCQMIHLNGNHDVLLGIGKRFAIFVDFQDTDTVKIVDLVKKETIAQHYLPPCRPSRNGSTLTLGQSDWLDGTGPKTEGLFVAACLKSNDVLLLKWKEKSVSSS